MSRLTNFFYKRLLKTPFGGRYSNTYYRKLGIQMDRTNWLSNDIRISGLYSNIIMDKNAEINSGCFLLAMDKIILEKTQRWHTR